jgi:nitrogen-specific signal transduction histidine kinase
MGKSGEKDRSECSVRTFYCKDIDLSSGIDIIAELIVLMPTPTEEKEAFDKIKCKKRRERVACQLWSSCSSELTGPLSGHHLTGDALLLHQHRYRERARG